MAATDDLSAERAFLLDLLQPYFRRLPRALRTGVAQPGGKTTKFFPVTVPRDMWDGQPDEQGLVVWKPSIGELNVYDWIFFPVGVPPLHKVYLYFWRGCGIPLRVRGREIWLQATPTHLPAFATDRFRGKYDDFKRATGYAVFADTRDADALICFDLTRRDTDGDSPVVLLPADIVNRLLFGYDRQSVESHAEVLAPTFRAFLTAACSDTNEPWPSDGACPCARVSARSAGWSPFDWTPYLAPARKDGDDANLDIAEVDRHCVRIKAKLDALRRADPGCLVSGSQWHQHRMNPPIRAEGLAVFEEREKVSVPTAYARFLLQVGNGGVGPHRWLYQVEVSSTAWLRDAVGWHEAEDGRLGQPFPHRSLFQPHLEIMEDPLETDYRDYMHPRHVQGSLRLTELKVRRLQCELLLIATGPERGHLWIDDRARGRGIYPLRQQGPFTFLAWFEQGLDYMLDRIDTLYAGLADRSVEEFENLADAAFVLNHLSQRHISSG